MYLRLSFVLGMFILFNLGLKAQDESDFQIAYEYSNYRDICLINIDGTGNTCLTDTDDVIEHNLIWSPSGRLLSYGAMEEPVGLTTSESFTYVYDFEEGTTTQLQKAWHISDWSPDGEFLLTVNRGDMNDDGEIAILRPDGSGLSTLTDNEIEDYHPSWSPNGQEIVYVATSPKTSLRVMPASGGSYRVLTDTLDIDGYVAPQWSPDGKTIAFSAYDGEQPISGDISEIYTISADGSNLRQLTFTDGVNWEPRWSPDGEQLVFWGYAIDAFDDASSTTSLRTEVFLINADGSNLVNLTQSTGLDYQPEWSPDGQWIAFASVRVWDDVVGQMGIFIMRPDGSDVQMVTNEPSYDEGGRESNNPVWRPVGGG